MASINNLEVKGVKFYPDHEGASVPYGNVYFKGKRVASFRADSRGGPMIYEHTHKTITNKEVLDAFDEIPKKLGWNEFYNSIEILIDELVELKEFESEFKKAQKKNHILILIKGDNSLDPFKGEGNRMIPTSGYTIFEDSTNADIRRHTEKLKQKNGGAGIVTVYRSLDDFIL